MLMRLALMGVIFLGCTSVLAEEKIDPPKDRDLVADPLTEQEQAFVDLLTNTTLVGSFTTDLAEDQGPKAEEYAILSVSKISGDNWVVTAKMTAGNLVVPIPVPVQVKWAGETPMIQLTDLAIPLLGEGFSARVLFYENRYAGTWQHGKFGGHLWGRVVKNAEGGQ